MPRFELNILGCGSAVSTKRHKQSSQVLNIRDSLYMIDCGEGAQEQFRRQGLNIARLGHIFISHLHGDHFFGLPGMISTLALMHKTSSLTIHILAEGKQFLQYVIDEFCTDLPYELTIEVIPAEGGVVFENDAITVTAFPLDHRVPCVGFRFSEKPKQRHINGEMVRFYDVPHYKLNAIKQGEDFVTDDGKVIANDLLTTAADPVISYAYCSDTRATKGYLKHITGVTWIYHEATYGHDFAEKAHQRYHSTAHEAGEVAHLVNANGLILGHYSKRYNSAGEHELLKEAQAQFSGKVLLSNEGDLIDLNAI